MFLLFITQRVMTELRTTVTPRVVTTVTSTEIATAAVALLHCWCGTAINDNKLIISVDFLTLLSGKSTRGRWGWWEQCCCS